MENPNYIANTYADQTEVSALAMQSISHSQTLDKYLSQYRIQRNNIASTSLDACRTATAQKKPKPSGKGKG